MDLATRAKEVNHVLDNFPAFGRRTQWNCRNYSVSTGGNHVPAITRMAWLPFDEPMPPPAADGRTGCGHSQGGVRVLDRRHRQDLLDGARRPWQLQRGDDDSWPGDAGGCNGHADVAELLSSYWVTLGGGADNPRGPDAARVNRLGPLAETQLDPDVVLLRLTARQLIVLSNTLPGLRIEGKPQCHIVAVAKEQGEVAASVGCQLSRVRTGMAKESTK